MDFPAETMYTIKDLVTFSIPDTRVAIDRLIEDRSLIQADYRKIMREVPNLHVFFERLRTYFRSDVVNIVWFRLWAAIKAEEELGLSTTLDLLRKIPDIEDRNVEIDPCPAEKPANYCLVILHELVCTASR